MRLQRDLQELPPALEAFKAEYRQKLEALEALSQADSPRSAEAARAELRQFLENYRDDLPQCVKKEIEDAEHRALLKALFPPKPPAGVKASRDRSDGVLLIWEPSPGATDYLVYVSETGAASGRAFIDTSEKETKTKFPETKFLHKIAPSGRELCSGSPQKSSGRKRFTTSFRSVANFEDDEDIQRN